MSDSSPTRYINLGGGARQLKIRLKARAPSPQPNGPVPSVYDSDTADPPVNYNLATGAPDHDYQVDLNSVQASVSRAPTPPANEAILKAAEQFAKSFPAALGPRITSVRDFFLAEVLPLVASVDNGLADATDVVKNSLEEEPDTAGFMRLMSGLSMIALRIKAVSFLSTHFNMSAEEHALFRLLDLMASNPQGNHDVHDLKSLMHQVLEVSRLQRQTQNKSRSHLRSVQAAEGRKPRSGRNVVSGDRPKERKPRVTGGPKRSR